MSFKEEIESCFMSALERSGIGSASIPLVLERPRLKKHGDIATPIALSLAKLLKRNPMEIAEKIAGSVAFPAEMVANIDVVKPGYINLRLSPEVLAGNLLEVDRLKNAYGSSERGRGVKCQVEYVSANPTGPLVVVSARAAAVGSVIVNLLRAVGFNAEGEYYVNDSGNQVQALGESLRFRVRECLKTLEAGEEIGAYPGEYLKTIAGEVTRGQAEEWEKDDAGSTAGFGRFATDRLLEVIEVDLERFGVRFDSFFRESSLHPERVVEARDLIESKGFAYMSDGALYFRTTSFGDEKDRVLVKSDGNPTYFLGDIAYHRTKLQRGYEWVIDILGPDHHGHIPRMKAAASVLGADADWLRTLVVGWVRLLEGNKPVSMSKRAGDIIPMRELIEEVGPDVTKYFFLMRRANSPLDFDLDLARKQSEENPVYYVQYAHARIASVTRFAREKQLESGGGEVNLSLLDTPEERDLMVHLLFFPYVVESSALSYEPHRMTVYAKELAALFHQFYHARRIVTENKSLSMARLLLAESTKQVLRNALLLMGVSAPSSM